MYKYNNLYSHEDVIFSNPGSEIVDKNILDFPDRGGVSLKKTGEINLYDMIQANKVNCDLNNVLDSVSHVNQYSVLDIDSLNDVVADYTTVTNLGELYSSTKRIENTWYDLPLEVRENFDGNIKQFIRSIGTDSFNDKVLDGFNRFNGVTHSDLLGIDNAVNNNPMLNINKPNIDSNVNNIDNKENNNA